MPIRMQRWRLGYEDADKAAKVRVGCEDAYKDAKVAIRM